MPAAPSVVFGGTILVTPSALPVADSPLKLSTTGQLVVGLTAGDIPDLSGTYATLSHVSSNYQPLDADLTALAALTGTNTIYYRSAPNTWSQVTIGSGLSFSSGTLARQDTEVDEFTLFTAAGGGI